MVTENITLPETAQLYLGHLQHSGKNTRTLYTYGKDLEQIQAFFGAQKSVTVITCPQIGKFLKSEILLKLSNGQDRAPQTVQKTLRVLRMFTAWLREQGYLGEVVLPKSLRLQRGSTLARM
jgi:site-specific recombinase XerD